MRGDKLGLIDRLKLILAFLQVVLLAYFFYHLLLSFRELVLGMGLVLLGSDVYFLAMPFKLHLIPIGDVVCLLAQACQVILSFNLNHNYYYTISLLPHSSAIITRVFGLNEAGSRITLFVSKVL